jgi:hypothetical protein
VVLRCGLSKGGPGSFPQTSEEKWPWAASACAGNGQQLLFQLAPGRRSWQDARGSAVVLEGSWAQMNQTRRMTRKPAISGSASPRNAAWRGTRSTPSRAILRRRRPTLLTRWSSLTTRRNLRIWTGIRSWARRRNQVGRAMDKSGKVRRRTRHVKSKGKSLVSR